MARSLLALRLAVILSLFTSFVGPSAAFDANVGAEVTGTADSIVAKVTPVTGLVLGLVPEAKAIGQSLFGTSTITLSGPLLDVKNGLQNVAALLTAAVTALKNEGAVATSDASKVSAAFLQFTVAEQQLLAILISKAALFTLVPSVVQPVAPVLQSLQTLVDALAYTLYTLVQTSQADVDAIKNAQASLDLTLGLAVSVWNVKV